MEEAAATKYGSRRGSPPGKPAVVRSAKSVALPVARGANFPTSDLSSYPFDRRASRAGRPSITSSVVPREDGARGPVHNAPPPAGIPMGMGEYLLSVTWVSQRR